jgi:hypothetical protein
MRARRWLAKRASTGDCGIPAGNGRSKRNPPLLFFSPLGVYGLPHINSKQFLAVMRVGNAVLDSFSNLFRSQGTLLFEKFYSVVLFITGLSLREMKDREKRFYNNVNSKKLKSEEELITAIAATHNVVRAGGGEVIPT